MYKSIETKAKTSETVTDNNHCHGSRQTPVNINSVAVTGGKMSRVATTR